MKLDVKKDRIEINKIIENILPLMIKNKNLTQECADCIIVYFIEKIDNQQKKDDEVIPVSHLETRSSMEEDNTWDCKTNDVDNHADTDALSLTAIDGRRNPQDCSGQANKAKKEDTNKCVLPVDSKFQGDKGYNEEWDSYYDEKKDIWLEEPCQYKDCEFCSNRPTKPSDCVDSK